MVKDKVVIVTGASSGLGKELAIKLGKLGAKVVLVARREKLLIKIQDQIMKDGGVAISLVCDVTDREQINRTVKIIVEKFGTVDILVNGAGIWTKDEYEEKKPELIEQAFKVNSLGPIYFTKAILPILKKKNKGHIFNVISDAGLDMWENGGWPTYTATKWAITGYTRALKYMLTGTGIKVSAFYPGGFESNIFETLGEKDAHNQPWMMRTSDVAEAVIYVLNAPEDLWINSIGMSNI